MLGVSLVNVNQRLYDCEESNDDKSDAHNQHVSGRYAKVKGALSKCFGVQVGIFAISYIEVEGN